MELTDHTVLTNDATALNLVELVDHAIHVGPVDLVDHANRKAFAYADTLIEHLAAEIRFTI